MTLHDRYTRWLYAGGRPNGPARFLNRISAGLHARGVWPQRLVTLELRGRRTGRLVSFPLVLVDLDGDRYLVSMLGERANWVHNLRAGGGDAVLRHGVREDVHLEDVEPAARAPILRRFLACAPGARPHFPVDRRAPLAAFARIAPRFPVYRVLPGATGRKPGITEGRTARRPGSGATVAEARPGGTVGLDAHPGASSRSEPPVHP